jgi:hypothetical protein
MTFLQFVEWVRRQFARLDQRFERIDMQHRIPRASASLLIVVDQGNTLETGQPGIVYEATVASVPSAYDPDVTSSFIDGIGRGTLYKSGVAQEGYVLIVNSDDGSFRNALFQGDPFVTSGAISIPVAGGGSISAYTVGT